MEYAMEKIKVLVVDDESRMRKLVSDFLTRDGYEVIEAGDGEEAVEIFFQNKDIAVILLDVMMPKMNGWQVLKTIREYLQGPVIMLTAKDSEVEKIIGLDSGADDYVTKPFSVMELMARVRAQLRRYEQPVSNKISLGTISINTDTREVFVNGEEVKLTFKEYELLVFLIENGNKVVSRDELLNKIWGYEYTGETRTIDIHIKTLRQKLGTAGDYIKTIRGMGYRAVKE